MSQWLNRFSNSVNKGTMSEHPPARPMKYPYTYSAKLAQFPYAFYYKHAWVMKYWIFGTLVTLPFVYKIQQLSYSPANVKKWEEIERQELYGKPHH